jgi:hypothetical protein
MTKPEEKSKLPKRLKEVENLTFGEISAELVRTKNQFCIIHDLPKVDGKSPSEYMHEALEGLRSRCIALHWQSICLLKAKRKTAASHLT